MARLGEALAAQFLIDRGADIVGRNTRAGRGEIDILARFPDGVVAVEVKTRLGGPDPREAFTATKAAHVRTAMRGVRPPPQRLDFIAVSLTPAGADIRWMPGV